MKQKNVLLLAIDQWRADCFGFMDHPMLVTPHIDKLTADSAVFTNHYTVTAPCGPARTSLLTGLYPMNHRSVRNGTPLDSSLTNIAKEVRKQGYRPVLFGYTDSSADLRLHNHNDPQLKTFEGVLPGFDVEAVLNEQMLEGWAAELNKKGYSLPDDLYDLYRTANRHKQGYSTQAACYKTEDSDTAYIIDKIIDYTQFCRQPWFVHGVVLKPHPPLIAPEPYNRMYDPDKIILPHRQPDKQTEAAGHPYLSAWLKEQDRTGQYTPDINTQKISDAEARQLTATYYGLISEADAHLGRLFSHLKEIGQWDNTLIVFTSDHGEQLGEHWCWGKGGYFDVSYHIPLIIRDPDRATKNADCQQIESFTESVDIMPTILEWLDIEIPQSLSGVSLIPEISGNSNLSRHDYAYWEFDFRNPGRMFYENQLNLKPDQCCLNVIRDSEYKYVHFAALPPLLFDVKKDPHELANLAQSPKHQKIVQRYCQRLLSHKMLHADRRLSNIMLGGEGISEYRGSRL